MNGVLVMRTVQVKPVKADEANLAELGERRDKEGEREGATLREGRPGSARRQIVSSLSYGSPSHPWRHRDEKSKTTYLETVKAQTTVNGVNIENMVGGAVGFPICFDCMFSV